MALPVWGSEPTTAYGQALPLYITVRNRRDSGQVRGCGVGTKSLAGDLKSS